MTKTSMGAGVRTEQEAAIESIQEIAMFITCLWREVDDAQWLCVHARSAKANESLDRALGNLATIETMIHETKDIVGRLQPCSQT